MSDITAKQKALEHIITTDKEFLTPVEVAPVLGVDAHNIRLTARHHPEALKFDVIVLGSRTKIPRIPFLRFIGINVNNLTPPKEPKENPQKDRRTETSIYDGTPITNEELLLAITQQINTLKKEINERLDSIEKQMQDNNDVLISARSFINALLGGTQPK